MVRTFGSRRSHPSLSDGSGSGRPERRPNLPYSKTSHATIEVRAIAAVAVVNQESRWRSIPVRSSPLSDAASLQRGGPPCSRPDDEEDVKRLEQDCRDTEKVASPHVRCMLRQELSPYPHIFGGNLKPQPRQFGLNALLTPKAILGSHACDQSLKLYRDRRAATSFFMRGSPPPVRPPTRSLPAQNCFRFHNKQRMTPIAEPSACQDPKAPIGVSIWRRW
jgi:hypothetical protein